MGQTTKTPFDKTDYPPAVFKTYKVIKKLVKYLFYSAAIYFAYKGFMAWQ